MNDSLKWSKWIVHFTESIQFNDNLLLNALLNSINYNIIWILLGEFLLELFSVNEYVGLFRSFCSIVQLFQTKQGLYENFTKTQPISFIQVSECTKRGTWFNWVLWTLNSCQFTELINRKFTYIVCFRDLKTPQLPIIRQELSHSMLHFGHF